jgi:hypothetical protein
VSEENKPEDVRALIARAKQVSLHPTPGPWIFVHASRACEFTPKVTAGDDDVAYFPETPTFTDKENTNARFIAEARTLVPQLADACEQLLELVRRLQWGRNGFCPARECNRWHTDGHTSSCPIAALGLPADDG